MILCSLARRTCGPSNTNRARRCGCTGAPPLARALYHNVELNREIPGPLYGAVAEVLAWVYQLRRFKTEGGAVPMAPTELDVPAELDKGGVSDDEADQEAADTLNPANPDNDDASGASA